MSKLISVIDEKYYYREENNWACVIDDEAVKLGLVLEVLDLREIDPDIDDDDLHPYVIQASIVPQKPDERFYEGDEPYKNEYRMSLIFDYYSYCGSVCYLEEPIKLKEKFTLDEASLHSYTDRFTKSKKSYLRFSDKALDKALELYSSEAEKSFTFIGFILDKPVNLIGTTGWDELAEAIKKD